MLIRLDTLTPWRGEVIDGIRHPSNIEALWSAEDLRAIGLAVFTPFTPPAGKRCVGPESYIETDGVVYQHYDVEAVPPALPSTTVDGTVFLDRVTDAEYAMITGAALQSPQLGRWLDLFRLRGEINVASVTAMTAKECLIQAGLLTAERAEVIFRGAD